MIHLAPSLPIRLLAAGILLFLLAGCNMPGSQGSAQGTLNVTQAYQTVEARLTEAGMLTPSTSPQPTSTDSDLPTETATPASATTTSTSPVSPTAPVAATTAPQTCDVASPGSPIDVTIPDDTMLQPGQSFTKTWRLQNSGSCTWTRQYAVTFFSGEQMGAPVAVNLAGDVLPGQSVDISVDMVAPATAGQYQGNWKLRNAANVLFGIGPNGSSPFWVRIIVASTVTPTVTPPTPTITVTPTATPIARATGTATLSVNQSIDLDSPQVISGVGGDVTYQSDPDGQHVLIPQGSALLGVYGTSQPGLSNCQASALGTSPIAVDNLATGTYLCYRTDQGYTGSARINAFNVDDFQLTLQILTWSIR